MALSGVDFGNMRELHGFARAMIVAGRRQLAEPIASRLAEHLVRQASIVTVHCDAASDRVAIFSRFLQLHRRHVWKTAADECDYEWPEHSKGGVDQSLIHAVQALPLELREVLLLATLTDFTHQQAAAAAGLSFAQFVEQLDRARKRLASLVGGIDGSRPPVAWERAPHLRVVK
jgi:hypothetical protein